MTDWDGPDGIRDMQKRLPSVQVREFVEGGHSIHNTATEKFMEALLAVIDDAAKAAAERPAGEARGQTRLGDGVGLSFAFPHCKNYRPARMASGCKTLALLRSSRQVAAVI